MKRPNVKAMTAQAAAWNDAYPVGSPVRYRNEKGEIKETHTRTKAEILSGHSAVIWVDGVGGCVSLDRVTAI